MEVLHVDSLVSSFLDLIGESDTSKRYITKVQVLPIPYILFKEHLFIALIYNGVLEGFRDIADYRELEHSLD